MVWVLAVVDMSNSVNGLYKASYDVNRWKVCNQSVNDTYDAKDPRVPALMATCMWLLTHTSMEIVRATPRPENTQES